MSLDVKTKCKHCGKVFAVRKGFLYEHPYAETKEEWEEAAFISEGSGIEAFCPACRKYEIMIQYKRERRLHDFAELSEILDGFIYVGKIKDRKMWINNIPEEKGVYAITRETTGAPIFLEIGTGGYFKKKDPNISIEELAKKWYYSNNIIFAPKLQIK